MRRIAVGLATTLLTIAVRASAGDGDGPVLTPPAEMPAAPKAATAPPAQASPPTVRPPLGSPGARAVLAVPGLTTPPPRQTSPVPTVPALEPSPSDLGLEPPIEMRGALPSGRGAPPTTPGAPSRPLVLESTPGGEPLPIDGHDPGSGPSTKKPSSSAKAQTSPSSTAPARRARLFGLLPGPPAPAATRSPSTTRIPSSGRASTADDFRDDPAVDSALKQRIEKQARLAVGDRARSVEVKVVGKNAQVQAQGVKFYQKRAVRKALEGLPALSGMRSTIEINE